MRLSGRGWHGGGHLSTTELVWFLTVLFLLAGVATLVVAVRNVQGRGYYRTRQAVEDYARRSCYGDVDRAAARVRSVFPLSLTIFAVGVDLLVLALVGERKALAWAFWPIPLGVTLLCVLWIVVERELAFPGVLVPPGARGTRGLIRARRAARSSGQPG